MCRPSRLALKLAGTTQFEENLTFKEDGCRKPASLGLRLDQLHPGNER
jgi:hypothetical protein